MSLGSSSFSDYLRDAEAQRNGFDSISSGVADSRLALTLHQLSDQPEFARLVNCCPGQMTFIVQDPDNESLRSALLGVPTSSRIDLRLGSEPLPMSAVYLVDPSNLWGARSPRQILTAIGISSDAVQSVLNEVGLELSGDLPVEQLDEVAQKHFAIAHSFFSKARIIVYDRPFNSIDSYWVEKLALLMLESAQVGNRIAIVTGVSKIPGVWRSNPLVQVEGSRRKRVRTTTFSSSHGRALQELNASVRTLIESNRSSQEQEAVTLTRPQMIRKSRARSGIKASFHTEKIQNPLLEELIRDSKHGINANGEGSNDIKIGDSLLPEELADYPGVDYQEPMVSRGESTPSSISSSHHGRRLGSHHGSLTKVTWWHRATQLFPFLEPRDRKAQDRINSREGIPNAALASAGLRRRQHRMGLIIVSGIVLAILLLMMI